MHSPISLSLSLSLTHIGVTHFLSTIMWESNISSSLTIWLWPKYILSFIRSSIPWAIYLNQYPIVKFMLHTFTPSYHVRFPNAAFPKFPSHCWFDSLDIGIFHFYSYLSQDFQESGIQCKGKRTWSNLQIIQRRRWHRHRRHSKTVLGSLAQVHRSFLLGARDFSFSEYSSVYIGSFVFESVCGELVKLRHMGTIVVKIPYLYRLIQKLMLR